MTTMIRISSHFLMRRQQLPHSTSTHHQRISKCFLSTTGKDKKTRRRKKPSIRTPSTKDRIRRRQRTTSSESMNPLSKPNVELLTERMITRLEWVQKSLKNFTKDSPLSLLTSSSSSSSSNQATKAATATTKGDNNNPRRLELVMDSNWWFWNILLALTPGILIAIGCEFYVKPQMIELHLEKGGEIGLPPQLTWRESLEQMTPRFIQSILFQNSAEEDGEPSQDNKDSSSQSTSTKKQNIKTIEHDDPLLLQFQELKEKLQELELKINDKKNLPEKKNKSEIWKRHHHPLEDKRTASAHDVQNRTSHSLDKKPSVQASHSDLPKELSNAEAPAESSARTAFTYVFSLPASALQKIGTWWNTEGASSIDEVSTEGESVPSVKETPTKPKEPHKKQQRANIAEPTKPSGKHDVAPAERNAEKRIIVASDDSDYKLSDVSDYRDSETKSRRRQWWKLW